MNNMNRRTFLQLTGSAALGLAGSRYASAALPKMKITRVRVYEPPNPTPLFNQSDLVLALARAAQEIRWSNAREG
jgi:hypothetical protein